MAKEAQKQVIAVRLAGYELFALNQYADILDVNRSEGLRSAMVASMRNMMLSHAEWPMHPAWASVGNDQWVVTQFQHWAYAITDADPSKFLEKVKLDNVSAFRWREGRPTPKLAEWSEHMERYRERKEKKERSSR